MKKLTLVFVCFISSNIYSQNINLEVFASGFSNPVNIKHANDNRLFVAERAGIIKIMDENGTVNSAPFLDINDRVTNAGSEEGLLAMAFHPNYASNGYFYVNYIDNGGDTVISRFTRSTANSADSNSEQVLFSVGQPFINHNGGDLHFGPNDGYLYISLGDGGAGGDPGNRAQDLNNLLGKMLRIDVDGTSNGNYGIPGDNPYIGNPNALDEIWSFGLRNTWKFSFDRTTGDLWTADVGQAVIEEINIAPSNSTGQENYGWKCYEGDSVYSTTGNDCPSIDHHEPVAQYTHSGGTFFRCSITGGYVYRGSEQTLLQGLYFFADFCSSEIGYVEETSTNNYELTFIDRIEGAGWSAFGEDVNGELYAAALNTGIIYKILEDSLSVEESSVKDIKMYPNPVNDVLTFDLLNTSNVVTDIKIHDMHGKLVQSQANFDTQVVTMSTKSLASGIYIVEIIGSENKNSIRKLIVN